MGIRLALLLLALTAAPGSPSQSAADDGIAARGDGLAAILVLYGQRVLGLDAFAIFRRLCLVG